MVFDTRDCESLCPVVLMFLSMQSDLLREMGVKVRGVRSNDGKAFYLLKIFGFFPTLESSIPEEIKQQSVGVRKITQVRELSDLVQDLVTLIKARTSCNVKTGAALDWVLTELLDNSGTHGYKCYTTGEKTYPKPVYACGFSYEDRVEIAIGDFGQGIHESLKLTYPEIEIKEALEMAIKKGVSGHPNGSPGFGLYGASELARRGGGSFYIWSSGHGIEVRGGSKPLLFSGIPTNGTFVSFSLNKSMEVPFQEILGRDTAEYFDGLPTDNLWQ